MQFLTLQTSSLWSDSNYCTQILQYTHACRKRIRKKVNKKFDQIKLLKCRMWLEKCSDRILFIFKQPALLSLIPLLSTHFALHKLPKPIPFPAFHSISYHPILCPCISHSPGKHHSFSWQDPSCLTHHDGFRTCKMGLRFFWDSHERGLKRISLCLDPYWLPASHSESMCLPSSGDGLDMGWWFLWWTWEQPG